jgi:hypothetical protein
LYIIRFNKEALHINICNLYPSLELTSPVYCSNSTCHVSPIQQTCIGITLASFEIASNQKAVKGALLYKLRRIYADRNGNHLNNGAASVENTETDTYLLVVWDVENYMCKFSVCLLEFTDAFTWDEDKLWALRHKYSDQFYENYNYLEITWLMRGGPGMKTKFDVTYGSDYKLDIVIYEGTGKYGIKRPIKIDPKRLVLPLSMLTVLIYDLSLFIEPSVKLNIHNQCRNVSLTSPIYITGEELEFHKPPDYKICAGDTMKSGFTIRSDDESYGVLIYKLQRSQPHESTKINENASKVFHLLVVWKTSILDEIYADVLLVECDKGFTWNEDNLNELYYVNYDQFKKYDDITSYIWFMDNNMILETTFNVRNLKGNHELSISISEERNEYAINPFYIDLTR